MPTHSFDLLTMKAVDGPGSGYEPQGLLTQQSVDLTAKHPIMAVAAKAVARLRRRPEARLLGLEMTADPETNRLSARPTGMLAPLIRKQIDRTVRSMNGLGRPITLREGGFVYNLYQPPVPSERMIHALARRIVLGREAVRPTTATLQVTSRCQLDCYHCSAARFKSGREELTTDEWRSVIREAQDLGIFNIVFTGGEPLLRKGICDLIAAVDRRRAHPMMFTNGLLLTDENVARLVEAGLYSVMVSLDDPRPEVHNQLRRAPQGFEKATEGLRRAVAGGLLVGISTYAGPQDVRDGMPERMIEFGKGLGVHEVTVFDVVPTGKLLPLQVKELLSSDDKRRLIALERRYNALEDYPHIVTQAFINGPDGAGCFAGFSQFYMTAFGDVNPCDFTPLTFGNIRDEPLETIWRRMLTHPAYQARCDHCRMQDPTFRAAYIDPIPGGVQLPWPAFPELAGRPHGPR